MGTAAPPSTGMALAARPVQAPRADAPGLLPPELAYARASKSASTASISRPAPNRAIAPKDVRARTTPLWSNRPLAHSLCTLVSRVVQVTLWRLASRLLLLSAVTLGLWPCSRIEGHCIEGFTSSCTTSLNGRSLQIARIDGIHVAEGKGVLTSHSPDEGIGLSPGSTVNEARGGNHSLLIRHPQTPGLLRGTQQVANSIVIRVTTTHFFWKIEIQISLSRNRDKPVGMWPVRTSPLWPVGMWPGMHGKGTMDEGYGG